MIDHATYCDYRDAYAKGVRDNAHTGLMQQYEIRNYRPPHAVLYWRKRPEADCKAWGEYRNYEITTWMGDHIAFASMSRRGWWRAPWGDKRATLYCRMAGADYSGTVYDTHEVIRLRRQY